MRLAVALMALLSLAACCLSDAADSQPDKTTKLTASRRYQPAKQTALKALASRSAPPYLGSTRSPQRLDQMEAPRTAI